MAAPKTRTKAERETHLSKVAQMYCRGMAQYKIAEALGVDGSQITYDMKILMARWRKDASAAIDERKAREIEKIDQLEREYWQSWEQSIASAVKVSKEKSIGNEVVTVKQEVTKASGDPRFLQGVQWCIDQRCKIFGLYQAGPVILGDQYVAIKNETTILNLPKAPGPLSDEELETIDAANYLVVANYAQ